MVTAIVTILMFLVMVSLHEFGHFIVGRLLKFNILEYSIGFGPAILKSKKTKTQYSLRVIPFGGYCKFDGEDGGSDDPGAFYKQAVWKRFLVVMAGGVFNVILGFVLFLIIVPMNSPVATNVVESVVEHSYLEQSGVLPGDKIVEINGHNISFYDDITLYKQDFSKGSDVELKVKRGEETLTFNTRATEQVIVQSITENGIDVATSINGYDSVEHYDYTEDMPKDESTIGQVSTYTNYLIGFKPVMEDINFGNVWREAWNETRFVVKLVYQSLWQMITGKIGVDQMAGPVGIVSEVNTAVNSGEDSFMYVLNLIALLTINLGVFNLLPIPALDGGRLFFMLIEMIRRKPIPPEKEGMVHAIGMMLLFGLIIFVSFNDIMRLFGR